MIWAMLGVVGFALLITATVFDRTGWLGLAGTALSAIAIFGGMLS